MFPALEEESSNGHSCSIGERAWLSPSVKPAQAVMKMTATAQACSPSTVLFYVYVEDSFEDHFRFHSSTIQFYDGELHL